MNILLVIYFKKGCALACDSSIWVQEIAWRKDNLNGYGMKKRVVVLGASSISKGNFKLILTNVQNELEVVNVWRMPCILANMWYATHLLNAKPWVLGSNPSMRKQSAENSSLGFCFFLTRTSRSRIQCSSNKFSISHLNFNLTVEVQTSFFWVKWQGKDTNAQR